MVTRYSLGLGWRCNNQCTFCCAGTNVYDELPLDQVRCLLRIAADDGADELVLTGGEPTCRDDLFEIVREARKLGYTTVQLQTNGRMLYYADYTAQLIDAGITEFIVTVSGHTAQLHEGQTKVRGSHRQSMTAIRNIRRLGGFVAANVVATKALVPHLPAIARDLVKRDVSQVQVAFPEPAGRAYLAMDEVVPRLSDIRAPLREALTAVLEAERFATIEGFPLCTSPIHLRNAVEWREGEGGAVPVWERRGHGAPCDQCTITERCPGMWLTYMDRWGDDELEPVTSVI